MVRYGFEESFQEDAYDESDLHSACANGDVTLVCVFMGNCNCRALLEDRDEMGRTPLRVAVDHDQIEVVDALLQHPERTRQHPDDLNAKDDRGWTCMASACAFLKNQTMLVKLVKAGADLNWKDTDGSTLEELAQRKNNGVALSFLDRAKTSTEEDEIGQQQQQQQPAKISKKYETKETVTTPGLATESQISEEEEEVEFERVQTEDKMVQKREAKDICSICESAPMDVTLAPCQHRACDECSKRWKKCHVTLVGSVCGIACGVEITGRWRKIPAFVKSLMEVEEEEEEEEELVS